MSPSVPEFSASQPVIIRNTASLEQHFPSEQVSRIFLTGFMGAGKTTIGKLLAKTLGRTFYDTDQLVMKGFGNKGVSEIFKQYGEPKFREAEDKVVTALCQRDNFVASTGGGTLVRDATMAPALANGLVIYLYAPVELLFERVVFSGKDRPILSEPDTEQLFYQRFASRENFYQQAHWTVPTHEASRLAVVSAIVQALNGASKTGP